MIKPSEYRKVTRLLQSGGQAVCGAWTLAGLIDRAGCRYYVGACVIDGAYELRWRTGDLRQFMRAMIEEGGPTEGWEVVQQTKGVGNAQAKQSHV